MGKAKELPWRTIFIEIALRSIRSLHFEYSRWSITQDINDISDLTKLNQGPGIELAHETAVMASISQEFINSRFTNGMNLKNDTRMYMIDREVDFISKTIKTKKNKAKKYSVDLVIHRIKKTGKTIHHFKYPAVIEAKRAHLYTPEIISGKVRMVTQWGDIRNDIAKLKKIKNVSEWNIKIDSYGSHIVTPFTYVLFWGDIEQKDIANLENTFKVELRSKYKKDNLELRWFPIEWDNTPKISKWLWIALLEVHPMSQEPDQDEKNNWEPPLP